MSSITPCRTLLSDRFPVASFVVRVPPRRCFEVVCTTDPSLLSPSERHRRTPENFYTSRGQGLLRAPAGEATVLLPPRQLRHFAGSSKIYYAMGTYAGAQSQDPRFTALGDKPVPYIQLSPDFTGRGLDRGRVDAPSATYGAPRPQLTWGGDLQQAPSPDASGYDDGHDPALWAGGNYRAAASAVPGGPHPRRRNVAPSRVSTEPPPDVGTALHAVSSGDPTEPPRRRSAPGARTSTQRDADPAVGSLGTAEPPGHEDARGIPARAAFGRAAEATAPAAYGRPEASEPPGYEHAPDLPAQGAYGGQAEPPGVEHAADLLTGAEPAGFEDGAAAYRGGTLDSASRPEPTPHLSPEPPGWPDPVQTPYGGPQPDTAPAQAPGAAEEYGAVPAYGRRSPRTTELTPRERTRIVRPVFKLAGGVDAYGAVRSHPEGVRWGVAGFHAGDGSLRAVLAKAVEREERAVRSRRAALDAAVRYIDDRQSSPIRMKELCRVTGVSERTLQYAFRDECGMTPIEFVRARRLTLARGALLRGRAQRGVVRRVAHEHGFRHFGAFSGEYKLMFGELPSETALRT